MKKLFCLLILLSSCSSPYRVDDVTLTAEVKSLSYKPDTNSTDVGFSMGGDLVVTSSGSSESYNVVVQTTECGLAPIQSKRLFAEVKTGQSIQVRARISYYAKDT